MIPVPVDALPLSSYYLRLLPPPQALAPRPDPSPTMFPSTPTLYPLAIAISYTTCTAAQLKIFLLLINPALPFGSTTPGYTCEPIYLQLDSSCLPDRTMDRMGFCV